MLQRDRSFPAPLLASLAAVMALAAGAPLPGVEAAAPFELESFNRSYTDLAPPIAPVRQGPLTITLGSPRQVLILREHRIEMRPYGDGTHHARLEADFLGKGELVADLDLAGVAGRLEDEVLVPPQRRTVEARVRIARAEAAYEVTTVALQRRLQVDIQSRLANRVVGWCEQLLFIALAGVDCGGLERALSTAAVPLPPPGETYLIPYADLAADERRRIERYLSDGEGNGEGR
jgi:hypothetical protein